MMISELRHQITSDYINSFSQPLSVLDAGARKGVLESLLNPCVSYTPTDVNTPEHTLFVDLNNPLPYSDSSFDYVVCLDVLEHLNNPWFSMGELIRVSSRGVIISLPNMAYISFRFKFLLSGLLSDKYAFNSSALSDRHQWVTSFHECRNFAHTFSELYPVFYSIPLTPARGKSKFFMQPIESFLSSRFPGLFQYGTVFIFDSTSR